MGIRADPLPNTFIHSYSEQLHQSKRLGLQEPEKHEKHISFQPGSSVQQQYTAACQQGRLKGLPKLWTWAGSSHSKF
jgi:hypothetical protein